MKKLYLHLYGDESNQIHFDFDVPIAALGGKTGMEIAAEAYAQHVTQQNKGQNIRGVWREFSVEVYGRELYPATVFGLYASEVGEDLIHNDFLENLPGAVDWSGLTAGTGETAETVGTADAGLTVETVETVEPALTAETLETEDPELIVETVVIEEPVLTEETLGIEETGLPAVSETEMEAITAEQASAQIPSEDASTSPAAGVPAPEWADVQLGANGFLDEGQYVLEDEEEGHWMFVSPTIRVQIEDTVVTPDKKHPFHCFTAHIWCNLAAGELPHTAYSNPEAPRSDPKTIAVIGTEQQIVLATSTDYYTYRAGRKKNTKSVHVGIEIRNGEILWTTPRPRRRRCRTTKPWR